MRINMRNEKRLRTKLLVYYLLVAIIPISLFAVISSIKVKKSIYEDQVRALKQISSMTANNLDSWGDDNILLVEDIANYQVMYSNDLDSIRSELKNKQAQDSSIFNIMYTDTKGNVLTDSKGSINVNVGNNDYFKNVSKGYSYVSDIIFDSEKNIPLIVFSSPVKKENEILGYILNFVKAESIENYIGKILFSDKGTIYSFNSDGYITYDKNPELIMKENVLKDSNGAAKGASKALNGNFGSFEYKDKGEEYVASYNFIPSLKWGIMVNIPNSEIYSTYNEIKVIAAFLILVIIAIVVVIVLWLSKRLVKPISDLAELSKDVASGDLSKECNVKGYLEVSRIGKDFNEMILSLKKLVLSIQDKSNNLQDAAITLNEMSEAAEVTSKDIAKAMEEISEGSVDQATRADNILSQVRNLDEKMEELEGKIEETNGALSLSEKALIKGSNGTKELKDSTEIQKNIVSETVNEVKDLSHSVRNIDSIIAVISDIANQTSLLALNASIEAARAGESGKGFAVVAQEVAGLANESQNATKEIEKILNDIKNKSNKTTDLMNSMDEGMKAQFFTVEETLKIFNEIVSADSKIAENIKSFNGLIEFIKKFSSELLYLIETLASSSEESAAVAEEVTASSENQINSVQKVKKAGENILEIVDELKVNIEKFKTE